MSFCDDESEVPDQRPQGRIGPGGRCPGEAQGALRAFGTLATWWEISPLRRRFSRGPTRSPKRPIWTRRLWLVLSLQHCTTSGHWSSLSHGSIPRCFSSAPANVRQATKCDDDALQQPRQVPGSHRYGPALSSTRPLGRRRPVLHRTSRVRRQDRCPTTAQEAREGLGVGHGCRPRPTPWG